MALLPTRTGSAAYNAGRDHGLEEKIRALENHVEQLTIRLDQLTGESRYYYNDSVTSYTDDMPDDPPINDFVAWGANDGMLWVASNDVWTGIGQLNYSTVSVSSGYTTGTWDGLILCNASGGAFVVTLSTQSGAYGAGGKEYVVKKTDNSANVITVVGASGNIDGAGSYSLNNQYDSVWVRWDGSNWHVLATNP